MSTGPQNWKWSVSKGAVHVIASEVTNLVSTPKGVSHQLLLAGMNPSFASGALTKVCESLRGLKICCCTYAW